MRGFVLCVVFSLTFGLIGFGQDKRTDKEVVKQDTVIVYGSDTCHYCTDTKVFLKEQHVEFVYYDVDVRLEKQKEMVEKLQNAGIPLDAISLPVVDINGRSLKMNDVTNFKGFLKSLIEKTK
ncbi:glutaredoxin family protein [Hyunsoonleella pacifica]|uniref:Glutaredoxin family protein n=1 Tax=Hyunsoonleella pacifica TaxID=1080224 RepID=A0A4Q9FP32_9FLAO|nr:glutaredoxin family protein [Hyunsoonleella pacifica]TBN16475.1 glutaredoxin family protein [Hyunsoonleella pacifica]GGD19081.1 hypothetical protein GCM10011368_21260 [Hyunsoonleella pacifica]